MRLIALVLLVALVVGCVEPPSDDAVADDDGGSEVEAPDLMVTSAAFADGEPIPVRHTCDGENTSPPLTIAGAPVGAVALALFVIDSDVPTPVTPLREVVHWVAWNTPLENGTVTFAEDAVPDGTREHDGGWRGPCPPHGSPPHRYVFTVHALDALLDVPDGGTREDVQAAMEGHVLDTATLTGTYARAITGGNPGSH